MAYFIVVAECECGDVLQTEEHTQYSFWDCKLYEDRRMDILSENNKIRISLLRLEEKWSMQGVCSLINKIYNLFKKNNYMHKTVIVYSQSWEGC
jgi:hypothetical protein